MSERVWGLSKSEADYGPAPSEDTRCRNCRYMFPKTCGRHMQAGPRIDQGRVLL